MIYKVENKINGKLYVGQTTLPLHKRMKHHLWSLKPNIPFHAAILKYERHNFIWSILEETENKLLRIKEKEWINKLNTTNPIFGYNVGMLNNKNRSGKKRLAPMSINHRNAISKSMKGIKHKIPMSKEQKQFISNLRKNIPLSEIHKQNISKGIRQNNSASSF